MFELKKIHREAIPKALERVERYRLLNQPLVAESICRDILEVDAENQQALIGLVLALTDQFEHEANKGINIVLDLIPRLTDEYTHDYYSGLAHERHSCFWAGMCDWLIFALIRVMWAMSFFFYCGGSRSLPSRR